MSTDKADIKKGTKLESILSLYKSGDLLDSIGSRRREEIYKECHYNYKRDKGNFSSASSRFRELEASYLGYGSDGSEKGTYVQHNMKLVHTTVKTFTEKNLATMYKEGVIGRVKKNQNYLISEHLATEQKKLLDASGQISMDYRKIDYITTQALELYFNDKVDNANKTYLSQHEKVIQDMCLYSYGIKELVYDNVSDKIRTNHTSVFNTYFDSNSLDENVRVSKEIKLYKRDILKNIALKVFMMKKSDFLKNMDDLKPVFNKDDKKESEFDIEYYPITICQQFCWLDLDYDDIPEPYNVFFLVGGGYDEHILSIEPMFSKEHIKNNRVVSYIKRFIVYRFSPGISRSVENIFNLSPSTSSIGIGEMLLKAENSLDTINTATIKNTSSNVNSPILMDSSVDLDTTQVKELSSVYENKIDFMKVTSVDSKPISECFHNMPSKKIEGDVNGVSRNILEHFMIVSGQNPQMNSGVIPSSTKTGAVEGIREMGQEINLPIFQRIFDTMANNEFVSIRHLLYNNVDSNKLKKDLKGLGLFDISLEYSDLISTKIKIVPSNYNCSLFNEEGKKRESLLLNIISGSAPAVMPYINIENIISELDSMYFDRPTIIKTEGDKKLEKSTAQPSLDEEKTKSDIQLSQARTNELKVSAEKDKASISQKDRSLDQMEAKMKQQASDKTFDNELGLKKFYLDILSRNKDSKSDENSKKATKSEKNDKK